MTDLALAFLLGIYHILLKILSSTTKDKMPVCLNMSYFHVLSSLRKDTDHDKELDDIISEGKQKVVKGPPLHAKSQANCG